MAWTLKDLYIGRGNLSSSQVDPAADRLPIWSDADSDHHKTILVSELGKALSESALFRVEDTLIDRNNIPASERKPGMMVYVIAEKQWFTFVGPGISNSDWIRIEDNLRQDYIRVLNVSDLANIPSHLRRLGTVAVVFNDGPSEYIEAGGSWARLHRQNYRIAANFGSLPSLPDVVNGTVAYVIDENKEYAYVGGTWIAILASTPAQRYHVIDTYTNLLLVPTVGMAAGTTYITSSDGRQYYWDGASWVLVYNGHFHVAPDLTSINALPSHLKVNSDIWYSEADHGFYQFESGTPVRLNPWDVYTFAELQAACASPTQNIIILKRDITVTSNITIPTGKQVFFNGYKLIRSGTPTMRFDGIVVAGRHQIFDGWSTPGLIYGSFGGEGKFPEWWGLDDGASGDPALTGEHQIAINCAVKTWPNSASGSANVGGLYEGWVSLANRDYYVSAEIDLTESHTSLIGCQQSSTTLITTPAWHGTLFETGYYDWTTDTTKKCVSAVIWFGSKSKATFLETSAGHNMRIRIENIQIRGFEASKVYAQYMIDNPGEQRRLALIGCRGWIEENTIVRNCVLLYYNGACIYLSGVRNNSNQPVDGVVQGGGTSNGLEISHVWSFGGGMSPGCVGVLNTLWNGERINIENCTFTSSATHRESTQGYVATKAVNYFYLNENPTDGDTVTIDGRVYTFRETIANPDDILIGISKTASLDNLISAINNTAGEGTTYGTGTTINATFEASRPTPVPWGNFFRLRAKTAGTSGNSKACSTSMTDHSGWYVASTLGGYNATTPGSWPHYHPLKIGILSTGQGVRIASIHFEGCITGHMICDAPYNCGADISGTDLYGGMNMWQRWGLTGAGNAYDYEELWPGPPPTRTELLAIRTALGGNPVDALSIFPSVCAISRTIPGAITSNGHASIKSTATLRNLRSRNVHGYILLDIWYDILASGMGAGGQFHNTNQGVLVFYARSNVYRPYVGPQRYPVIPQNASVGMNSDPLPADKAYIIGPMISALS